MWTLSAVTLSWSSKLATFFLARKSSADPTRQVGDCHSSRCLKEWYTYANNITLSKYAFELQELFNYPDMKERFPGFEMGIFGHSPDTVCLFAGRRWKHSHLKAAAALPRWP